MLCAHSLCACDAGEDEAPKKKKKRSVEDYMVVSHRGRIFDDIRAQHVEGGHCKNKALYDRVFKAHGGSISHKIQVHMRSRYRNV